MLIYSLLDTDYYKLLMAQVVYHHFPNVKVHYDFINRGKTVFTKDFKSTLLRHLEELSHLSLTKEEASWLKNLNVFKDDFIDWLGTYRFKPNELTIDDTSQLSIKIDGTWIDAIFWEVPLMAMISEIYFSNTLATDFTSKIKTKAKLFADNGIRWADFGTRRRYSSYVQNEVVAIMSQYNGFQGTSNTQYAMKYKVTPIGTYAHEVISAMQAGFGVKEANRKWMNLWLEEYSGKMSIALTDTYTTKAFLKDFDLELANRFEGVRQDSGNPFEIGEILINHYESLGIDPKTKKVIFSDNLNPKKVLELNKAFKDRTNVIFGIGTNLTADCGHKPLNMVIKLTEADFGDGFKHAVKLSDDVGKHTGDLETINKIKGELNV